MTRSPFAVVTLVARVRGELPVDALEAAVVQAGLRHPLLRVRVVDDENHNPWFTSEGAGAIPIEVIDWESAEQWESLAVEAGRSPFRFDEKPPIRIFLLRSTSVSELVIMCHHILCDGLSLAYLARDILACVGDPDLVMDGHDAPRPITLDTIPEKAKLNPLIRFLIHRINGKWRKDPVVFDQADYEMLSRAYWDRYHHHLMSIELSSEATVELVARCRAEKATVNTALTMAFTRAQEQVLVSRHHPKVPIAGDLRGRLNPPVGEVMGFYASAVTEKIHYAEHLGFWENARQLQQKLARRYTDEALFGEPLTWSLLDPTILEAINFKKLGGLVKGEGPRTERLRAFGERADVVQRILERDGLDSLDRVGLGSAITNLTRLDFPSKYGPLELERMMMKPGGAFPLANVNILVGAATVAGRLSLTVEYVEDNVTHDEVRTIARHALGYLR